MCEIPTIYKAQAVRSRRDRVCEECGRSIPIGELHEYAFGIWEGRAENYRTCADCFEVRAELADDMEGMYQEDIACDLAFGNLREALSTAIREYA